MSSETSAPSFPSEPQDDESSKTVSKKAAKKEAAKQEKLRRRQEASLAAATSSISLESEEDPLAVNYGDVPLLEIQSKTVANVRDWTKVGELDNSLENQRVLIRGRAQKIHARERKNDSVQWYHNGHKKLIFSSEMGKKGGGWFSSVKKVFKPSSSKDSRAAVLLPEKKVMINFPLFLSCTVP